MTEKPLTQNEKPAPDRERRPELDVEMVKDLDVDETRSDALRGGNSGGGTRGPGNASR